MFSRREFLMVASAAACSFEGALTANAKASPARGPYSGKLCFFSKHLPDADWRRLARAEYDIPGATASQREDNTLVAAKRDLEFLNARLREAYP